MNRADVIQLITENRTGHGVHEAVAETARTVMCEVQSVRRSEYYTALNAGFQPEYVFVLALAEDYRNERTVMFHGQKFRVIRTYLTEDDGIEITVERSDERGTDEIDTGPDNGNGDA
jgi:SPP1 family predicted phage head-tail adaptor